MMISLGPLLPCFFLNLMYYIYLGAQLLELNVVQYLVCFTKVICIPNSIFTNDLTLIVSNLYYFVVMSRPCLDNINCLCYVLHKDHSHYAVI
jgi:hypothetical protein